MYSTLSVLLGLEAALRLLFYNNGMCTFSHQWISFDRQVPASGGLMDSVMDRDTNDVTLIRYVNRLSMRTGHSPIFQSSYQNFRD